MIPGGCTFDDVVLDFFHLLPKHKLLFNPPVPKYKYLEQKGIMGEIDQTQTLTTKIHYNNRVGEWEFIVLIPSGSTAMVEYKRIRDFFAGQMRTCVLYDDPDMNYKGRFYLTKWQTHELACECNIAYNVEPFRYSNDNIRVADWMWDELDFGANDPLLYGHFVVNGTKSRTLWNTSDELITPGFYCTAPMEVVFEGITYHLPVGQTSSPGFALHEGTNVMTFTGVGTVQMDYPLGVVI